MYDPRAVSSAAPPAKVANITLLRGAAEAILARTPPDQTPARSVDELLYEVQVHQIELEMQNETLREAQACLEESRDRFRDYYQFAPVTYLTLGEKGLITEVNVTGTVLLGTIRGKLLRQPFARFVTPEDADRWHLHLVGVLKNKGKQDCELVLQGGEGGRVRVRLDSQYLEEEGAPPTVRVMLTELGKYEQAEDELRMAAIAFNSQNGVMITDPGLVILRVNPAFTRLTGLSATESIGQTPGQLNLGRHGPQFYQRMRDTLKESGYWQGEIWSQRKNGQLHVEMLNIAAANTADLGITHYIGTLTDITSDRTNESELHRLAYYDPLTRLPNRRLLQDRLGQALAAAVRSGQYGAIFFIDLDNFKALNDTRGHDVGDLLLIEVAQRLRAVVRGGDTVSRQGGDEFVLLLEDLGAALDEAAALARQLGDKLYETLEQPFTLNGYEYHCKLSIGIGLFDRRNTVEDLIKNADLALYQAKRAGRNTLRFFDPAMQAAMDRRAVMETDLRQALQLKQFQLYYQAQVDAACRPVGAEASLRWQHPEGGPMLPGEFIPLAEDTGLILPIGLWGLETVCAQIKAWESEECAFGLQVSLNVSSRQFRQNDFVADVKAVLHASRANPARLTLELTEGLVLEDVQGTIEKMQAIKALGVRFALGAYGTGSFPLSLLSRIPFDQVKIDRSFVANLPEGNEDAAIVRTILTLGQGLDMKVIAEGVESEAQLRFLDRHGCHGYQGPYFSQPLSPEEFEGFVQRD